nr:unnamed protein product [Digitaria exilis]
MLAVLRRSMSSSWMQSANGVRGLELLGIAEGGRAAGLQLLYVRRRFTTETPTYATRECAATSGVTSSGTVRRPSTRPRCSGRSSS